ncbi:ATP-binding cassette domain-containing protein [Alkalibaculum sp. M08DMB]|uniref:ATP-binding cassette domain-containing protein n=1 Tax=Alkalibaculum sporogenes TaxID=2655001 RepID=A0A6A7K7M6_9FIRM|nr:ABC transporter ATP-binding protein [Alkalibaculum sporogenes]MPW25489.1 ATP-binding cassette domain-containing protein [Alkalibaculum sporogenes]
MIKLDNISYTYGDRSESGVRDIQIDIKNGECILLCGRSGCGKTTITKLINGLIPHFITGKKTNVAYVNGQSVDEMPIYELSKSVASVFQNPKTQFFNLDAESEIVFSLENQGIALDLIDKILRQTVNQLRIHHLLKKSMLQMSGGEKQIIAFACAYASQAEIIVLDEPSANLDLQTMKIIGDIISKLKNQGKTIIIAEHRISYLISVVDRVLFIEDGTIKRDLSGDEFFDMDENMRKIMGLRSLIALDSNKIQQELSQHDSKHTLKIENLNLAYGKQIVLENINFELHSDQVTALVGKNGMGKSTLARCICGLDNQKSGKIFLNGHQLNTKRRKKLSYMVMQDVNHQLFSESLENECLLGNANINKERIYEVLHALDLYKYKNIHPQVLSGGQKQRLAIATAILSDKKVLILDEPTSGLDYENMMKVSNLIKRLSKLKFIILLITHDMELVENTCNRLIHLNKNQIFDVSHNT